jgi:hypothetical protein
VQRFFRFLARSTGRLPIVLAIFLLLFGAKTAFADETIMIMDPKYYWTPVQSTISGASDVVLGFYRRDEAPKSGPVKAYKRSDARNVDIMRISALSAARSILAQATPLVRRDEHGVISMIQFQSNDPALSSILFLPELANRYNQLLGPGGCYAAVPERGVVDLFPHLSEPTRDFSTEIAMQFHNSSWPVSLDLFELTSDRGVKAVGKFNDDHL